MTPDEWLVEFENAVAVPDEQIDLARAALIIAADEYPAIDIAHYLGVLDGMAEQLRARIDFGAPAIQQVTLLNDFLFGELEFRGNRDEYYDPRNSYLNDVLDRRTGIPITLSIVYIEIAKRLGLPIVGVNMPSHFIVKWRSDDVVIFIDPFNGGQVIGQFALKPISDEAEQSEIQKRLRWMEAVGAKQILVRMLNNLRLIFLQRDAFTRALQIAEKILLLQPDAPEVLRQAALLAYQVKAYRRASRYLSDYLGRFPNSSQADEMRAHWEEVEEILLRLN